MIPRIIHQVWFQGSDVVPEKYGGNVERLRSLNPDWKHVIWSDADLRGMCQRLGKKYLKCYDSYKYMHQKIDFGRCVALWMHGGISVDMDVYALQPFDRLPFLRSQVLVVGQNPLPTGALENWMLRMPGPHLNNATFLCPRRSPAMRFLIDAMVASASKIKPTGISFVDVQRTTGPLFVSRALSKLTPMDVLVVSKDYFEPCVGVDTACKPPKGAFLDHQHDLSWISGGGNQFARACMRYLYYGYLCRYLLMTICCAVLLAMALKNI
jgi:mannosyltransferase OCH1-like enzyme